MIAVADPVGLPVELAEDVPVMESAAEFVPELRGLVEYDGKDDAEASIVTDACEDAEGAEKVSAGDGVTVLTAEPVLDCSEEGEREGWGDCETLGVPVPVLELVKD